MNLNWYFRDRHNTRGSAIGFANFISFLISEFIFTKDVSHFDETSAHVMGKVDAKNSLFTVTDKITRER